MDLQMMGGCGKSTKRRSRNPQPAPLAEVELLFRDKYSRQLLPEPAHEAHQRLSFLVIHLVAEGRHISANVTAIHY